MYRIETLPLNQSDRNKNAKADWHDTGGPRRTNGENSSTEAILYEDGTSWRRRKKHVDYKIFSSEW